MKVKQLRFILGFLLLLVSFQNCNSPNSAPDHSGASKDSKTNSSSSLASGSHSGNRSNGSGINSGNARGVSGGVTSSGGTGSGGIGSGMPGHSGGGGSGGSGNTGGTCLGCNGSGGGNAGGGSSGGSGGLIGGGDTTFKISTQPVAKTVADGAEFFVSVGIQGGRSPYTFKWYRDNEEILPQYGTTHYETYSNLLDRAYKEGEYHVTVKDGSGTTLTSNRVQVRMTSKICLRGNYFIDMSIRTNPNDGYTYFNDLFYYKNTKYLVSQYNPTISMMQVNNYVNNLNVIGFGYFSLGGDVSNNQNFSIECSTDVPTVHTSECATNNLGKCQYSGDNGYYATHTYEGNINFSCHNGFIKFISNTCRLVAPPPPPDTGGGP